MKNQMKKGKGYALTDAQKKEINERLAPHGIGVTGGCDSRIYIDTTIGKTIIAEDVKALCDAGEAYEQEPELREIEHIILAALPTGFKAYRTCSARGLGVFVGEEPKKMYAEDSRFIELRRR